MTLIAMKERIQDLAAKRRTSGTPYLKPKNKVKTCITKLYYETPKCLIQILPHAKLKTLQNKMTATMM